MFYILLILLLFFPKECVDLAGQALQNWFWHLLPCLFPFMLVSSMCIAEFRLPKKLYHSTNHNHYRDKLKTVSQKLLTRLWVILGGFLFGFPMGIKIASEYYEHCLFSREERNIYCYFCGNLSSTFLMARVLPVLQISGQNQKICLIIFYGIPILYGCMLFLVDKTHFFYKNLPQTYIAVEKKENDFEHNYIFREVVDKSINNMVMLGVRITLISIMTVIPCKLLDMLSPLFPQTVNPSRIKGYICCICEITTGLECFANATVKSPEKALVLSLVLFGGLGCVYQAREFIRESSFTWKYILHKCIQASIAYICFRHIPGL